MQIGLIGGIGPAATDAYYRRLITAFAARRSALDLTIVHADTPTLLDNLGRNDQEAQARVFTRLAKRLVSAGAGCVAVTSLGGHFCINRFKEESPLPVVDLLQEVEGALVSRGLSRLGVLGTRTVMESRFYGALRSVEILSPARTDLADVHEAYCSMATAGVVTEAQRLVFTGVSKRLLSEGAQAILLGGTDLALAFDEETAEFPVVDCIKIHVEAIADFSLATTKKTSRNR